MEILSWNLFSIQNTTCTELLRYQDLGWFISHGTFGPIQYNYVPIQTVD
jgi:hypothetical protein